MTASRANEQFATVVDHPARSRGVEARARRRHREKFAGAPLWRGTQDEAVEMVLDDAFGPTPQSFRLINAYSLYSARRNPAYAEILEGEGINLIDGRPLAWMMARRNARTNIEQVRGPALFEQVMDAGRLRDCTHFLLGGSADLLDDLQKSLTERYPGVDIVGTWAPPFRDFTVFDRAAYEAAIREAQPDIVWVGLGTPKQDFEAALLTEALKVTTVAVGAAFDFSAGRKPEAPVVLQRIGLEWGYRLVSEPRRLWRRYLFGNAYFVKVALLEHLVLRAGRRARRRLT